MSQGLGGWTVAEDQPDGKSAPKEPRMFFIRSAASEPLLSSGAPPSEDRFAALIGQGTTTASPIAPSYDPLELRYLVDQNDILRPCIEAYVANIAGTGWDLELAEETLEETDSDKKEKVGIEEFFDEPMPDTSFTSEAKKVIRDREETGNGYMEVLRNLKDEVMGLQRLDTVDMRFVKLDDPVTVKKPVRRFGTVKELEVPKRERRYVQIIGSKYVYYKEFGATRDLNKRTGAWETDEEPVSTDDRATEVIYFGTGIQDPASPYHLPRWIGNLPSILGSRKAETFNVEFFNSGGIPPLMLIVQGGHLAANAETALRDHFMTSGGDKHTAVILEAFASSGDVDSPNNVRVTAERFGADRQKDALFEEFITKCDFRIQRTFRLPSIFLGFTDQFSFAALHAAYTVTESQVFAPERRDFDEIVNLKIMPEIDQTGKWLFVSMPLTVRDVAQQLKAMELVKEIASSETLIKEVNHSVDLALDAGPMADPASDLEPGLPDNGSVRTPSRDRPTISPSARPGNNTPTAT